MDTEYIESVWWSLKRLHERGLLVEADKVTAYCPRCGTALSDAEVSLGYQTVEDPSVYVRFPITRASEASLEGAALLVWTTTPWTLPSNTGVAVDAEASYVVVEREGERLVVGAPLRERVLGEDGTVVATLSGADLVGASYRPPYPNVEGAHTVVAAGFVSMEDGTGLVHLAPAFGPEDLAIGRAQGWPIFKPVDDAGRFTDLAPAFVRGMFVKDADPAIVEELRERGVLLRAETYRAQLPVLLAVRDPLLYYARTSWYVRTTEVKDRLLAVNREVNWYPEHIRDGPLRQLAREQRGLGAEPRALLGHAAAHLAVRRRPPDGHRIAQGAGRARRARPEGPRPAPARHRRGHLRVPGVRRDGDARPRGHRHLVRLRRDAVRPVGLPPELGRGIEEFERSFPADFISEAIDQTRGWFYTLMAEGVLHFDASAYRNVVCLGHLVGADGRKMSKSLGNAFDPWEALDRQGADAVRWYMLTSGSPWASRRVATRCWTRFCAASC